MELPLPAELKRFPVVIRLPLLWGDQDAFGHVNNTVYIRWFESARLAYLEKIGLGDINPVTQVGPILAAIDCQFRRQLHHPDVVLVGAKVTAVGRSSFVMEHAIYSTAHHELAAEGDSTLVVFDYAKNQPLPMRPEIRQAIEAIEQCTLPAPTGRHQRDDAQQS